MSDQTKIEWTDTTWNPVVGCSRVSRGCERCYAERMAATRLRHRPEYAGIAEMTPVGPRWTGRVQLIPERLDQSLRWRKPRRVFVASMSDPFHDAVSERDLDRIMAVISLAPHHQFQLLTKRPARMRDYMRDPHTPFRVQRAADEVSVDREMVGVTEVWRRAPGFAGYHVSNLGRVRSCLGPRDRILSLVEHSGGYRQVGLRREGKTHTVLVHSLVLEAFARPRRDREEACHRNGDRTDNRIANLSWGTKTDNMRDAARHGTAGTWMKSQAVLAPEVVESIRARREEGALLDELAEEYGITRQQVSAIALGKIYKTAELDWPMKHLWLGVSAEDQATADERIPLLLQTPAAVRFVSAEPLLGPVDLTQHLFDVEEVVVGEHFVTREMALDAEDPSLEGAHYGYETDFEFTPRGGLHWVIAGGESGPGHRPMDPAWAEGLRDQCAAAGVPFFFKQMAGKTEIPKSLMIRQFPDEAVPA